ncbi:hypothetical protein GGS24DRAFT_508240 [Hypoxylon argillaceum]|nr:hypothetical protein GGS24DRAFT_508240 [Hypoxylon argillaceum]
MASDEAKDWPFQATVSTRRAGGNWESWIYCSIISSEGARCKRRYKTTGQYENHLLRHHFDSIQLHEKYLHTRNSHSQCATPIVNSDNQGYVQPFNLPGARFPQSFATNSANSSWPPVENATGIPFPATSSMNPASNPPVNSSNAHFVAGPDQSSFMGPDNSLPSHSFYMGGVNTGPYQMSIPMPGQPMASQSTLMTSSNGHTATGTEGTAAPSTTTTSPTNIVTTFGADDSMSQFPSPNWSNNLHSGFDNNDANFLDPFGPYN